MKKLFLLLPLTFLTLFALSGCGSTAGNTNTTANANSAAKANTNSAATKGAEPAKSGLKPGDVTADKVVTVAELAEAATSDEAAWKDKEVTVSGFVWEGSGAAENFVTITNDEKAVSTVQVSCNLGVKRPDGLAGKTVQVKGKISYVTKFGESKNVNLSPCELKK